MELGDSAERAEGPERPVAVTDDEFDSLLQSVFSHAETARRIVLGDSGSSWVWNEAGLEGADHASIEIMEGLVRERAVTGKCTRGHANRPYFMWRWRNRRIDAYHRMTAPARVPQEAGEVAALNEVTQGRRPRTELVGLWNDPAAAVRHEPADKPQAGPGTLDPIVVELVPRILLVLGARGETDTPRRTQLTPQQREATLLAMALDNGLVEYLDAEQLAYVDTLPERGNHWKRDLALQWRGLEPGTSHIDQSPVTRALVRGAEQIQLCMYLFTTLAPRRDAVTKIGDMDRLLDILDRPQGVRLPPTERLESTYRKRLRVAGETCVPHQGDFIVDTEAYLGRTLGSGSDDEKSRRLGLDALHCCETSFAVLVPKQVSPPQFACVLNCATHNPTSNDRES